MDEDQREELLKSHEPAQLLVEYVVPLLKSIIIQSDNSDIQKNQQDTSSLCAFAESVLVGFESTDPRGTYKNADQLDAIDYIIEWATNILLPKESADMKEDDEKREYPGNVQKAAIVMLALIYPRLVRSCVADAKGENERLKSLFERLIAVKERVILPLLRDIFDAKSSVSVSAATTTQQQQQQQVHPGVQLGSIHFGQMLVLNHAPKDTLEPVSIEIPDEHAYLDAGALETEASALWQASIQGVRLLVKLDSPPTNLATALMFTLVPLASKHPKLREQTVNLLLELADRKHAGTRSQLFITRFIKSGLVFLLRKHSLSESLSGKIMDMLATRYQARADVHYLGLVLKERGISWEPATGEENEYDEYEFEEEMRGTVGGVGPGSMEVKIGPDEQARAVLSALKFFASSPAQQHVPSVTLPANFNTQALGPGLISSMVLSALTSYGLNTTPDNGVAQWQSVIGLLRQSTAKELQVIVDEQKKEWEKNRQKMKMRKRVPFLLAPSPAQPRCDPVPDSDALEVGKLSGQRKSVYETIKALTEHVLLHSPIGARAEDDLLLEEDNEEEDMDTDEKENSNEDQLLVGHQQQESLALLDKTGVGFLYAYPILKGLNQNTQLQPSSAKSKTNAKKRKRVAKDDPMDVSSTGKSLLSKEPDSQRRRLELIYGVKQLYKGSRAYWTSLLSKWIVHLSRSLWFEDTPGTDSLKHALDLEKKEQDDFTDALKRQVFVPYLVEKFEQRWDLAVRWLWEEYYTARKLDQEEQYVYWVLYLVQKLMVSGDKASIGGEMEVFIPWMHTRAQNVLFRKFLTSLPKLPGELLLSADDETSLDRDLANGLLANLCRIKFTGGSADSGASPTPLEAVKLQLGLSTVYEVSSHFLSIKARCGDLLLECATAEDRARRSEALVVLQSWLDSNKLSSIEKLEAHALDLLKTLKSAKEPTTSLVGQKTDLYLWLCAKKPELLAHLFDMWDTLGTDGDAVVKPTLLKSLRSCFVQIGMPSEGNKGMDVLGALMNSGLKSGIEDVVMSLCEGLTQTDPPTRASSELAEFTINLIDSKPEQFSNPLLWMYLLDANGVSKEQAFRGMIILADGVLGETDPEKVEVARVKFCQPVARLLERHPAPESKPTSTNAALSAFVHPVDVCVLFNCLDVERPVNTPDLSLKKNMEATTLLMNHPLLNRYYSARVMCYSIAQIMDQHAQKAPTLFMRTVMATQSKFKDEVSNFILTHVLTRCVSFRTLWLGARMDSKNQQPTDDSSRRAKALWEGWVRLLKMLTPLSFGLLVQIPQPKMKQILEKCGNEAQNEFITWLAPNVRGNRVPQRYVTAQTVITEIKQLHAKYQH